jgi:hypothetical protein
MFVKKQNVKPNTAHMQVVPNYFYMKKLCILAVGVLFAITSSVSAQAPASRSEKKEVKREIKKGDKPEPKDMHHMDNGHKNCPQGKPQRKCCDPKQCKNGKPCANKKGCTPKHCKDGKPCPKHIEKEMPAGK